MAKILDTVVVFGKIAVLSIVSISFVGTLKDQVFINSFVPPNSVEYTFNDTFIQSDRIEVFNKTRQTDQNILYAFSKTNAVVIRYGVGGVVNGMMSTIRYMKENPAAKIIIDGPCMSACTLLLSLPDDQVKFTEKADFGFHTSYFTINGHQYKDNKVNKKMLQFFKPSVKDWIISSNAYASVNITALPRDILYAEYPNKLIKSTEIPVLDYIDDSDQTIMLVKENN